MEGVVVDDDRHFFPGCCCIDFDAALADHDDGRFRCRRVVDQFRLIEFRRIRRCDFSRYVGTGCTSPFLLFLHGRFKTIGVDGHAVFTGNFFGQFHREAVRIIEFEYVVAGEDFIITLTHHVV